MIKIISNLYSYNFDFHVILTRGTNPHVSSTHLQGWILEDHKAWLRDSSLSLVLVVSIYILFISITLINLFSIFYF